MVNFVLLVILILISVFVVVISMYLILLYVAQQFYTPPYPPNLRGSIEIDPDFEELIQENVSWSKKLMVRVWDPKNQAGYHGETILFSHGWDSSMGFFMPHIAHFIEKNWRVVAMDLRSMGESEYVKFASTYNFADDLSFVIRWIHSQYPDTAHLTAYCQSISGVSLMIGQGTGIIDLSLVDRFVIEGIFADGRYITRRFFKQFHVPNFLQKVFLMLLFRKLKTSLPKEHPYFEVMFKISNQHPINHLDKLTKNNKPLIIIHTKNDQVVPFAEFENYATKTNENIIFLPFETGGHFKLANQPDYFDRLEEAFGNS
ncbi:MAG: alpha/beta fold hydrolase [Candidatus Kariarchaeaceae archaeon]